MWIGARRFGTIVALPAALAAPCRLSTALDALTGRNTTAAKLHIDNYPHILSQVHGNAHVEPGPAAYPGPRYRIVPLHSVYAMSSTCTPVPDGSLFNVTSRRPDMSCQYRFYMPFQPMLCA